MSRDCWSSIFTVNARKLRAATVDNQTELELEAATFRRLRDYLREHTEVQNIDLMDLAGFCRNCLSKWYLAEAESKGLDLNYDGAREVVYGMPYAEWKDKHQAPANAQQQAAFARQQADADAHK
jgi:hypothetical protein